jgi:hypothetical protein
MLAAAGGGVFAQAAHTVCVARQHECAKTAKIVSCCCGEQGGSRDDSTPGQSRVEVRADMTTGSVLPNVLHGVSTVPSFASVDTSPPRFCPLDLPTLFSIFLI